MRLLINTPDFARQGGVVSYYQKLVPHFRHAVVFFTIGARVAERARRRLIRLGEDYLRFARHLRSNDYDVIVLNPSLLAPALIRDGLFLLLSKRRRNKTLVLFHGWDKACEHRLRKRWHWLFRRVYSQADAFVVLAQEFRDCLRDMGFVQPIHVETTAVEDRTFEERSPSWPGRRDHRAAFGILFLSRVVKAKGIYETLDAFALVRRRHRQATLTVAGDGEELERAREYACRRNLPGIKFTGYVQGEAKAQVYSDAHCYLFPTYHGEGMPNSVLEAMAYGLPVVTRPVGGVRDFFENGKMGAVTESLAPEVFAEHICQLIENPRRCEQIGRYNRQFAQRRFAASAVARRLEAICETLFKEKNTGEEDCARRDAA